MLRIRSRRAGFTLIELLVVIAIIGIIAAIIIPMFLDALQKSKQKRTMAEMRVVGTCWMAWLTDQVAAGAAGSSVRTYDLSLLQEIEPAQLLQSLYQTPTFFYCTEVPNYDGWGNAYEYYVNPDTLFGIHTMAIRSTGRDGVFSGTTYEIGPYVATDYDQDILWGDGFFIYYPAGRAIASAL